VKIVTYNVNGIKARLPRLLEYLEEAPDAPKPRHRPRGDSSAWWQFRLCVGVALYSLLEAA